MSDTQLEFHLPAPPVSGDAPLIPARMVNEFVYCPRLAYLMWTQGEWAETGDTVEGHRVHARVDRPSVPLPAPQALEAGDSAEPGKLVSRSLTLSSAALGVIAKLDIAEAEDGVVTPVDYKRGKRPHVAQGVVSWERRRSNASTKRRRPAGVSASGLRLSGEHAPHAVGSGATAVAVPFGGAAELSPLFAAVRTAHVG